MLTTTEEAYDARDGGTQPAVRRSAGLCVERAPSADPQGDAHRFGPEIRRLVEAYSDGHNLRCTLDDLHMATRAGRAVEWPTSNACVHHNLWYYASVLAQLQRRLPESRSCVGLGRTLDEVCALLGQARPDPSSTCPPCTECHEGA